MRASAANVFILVVAALTGGCKRKDYQGQCVTTIRALGVGFENVDLPRTEAVRKAQLDRMGTALDAWSASKDRVTLPDLRHHADELATTVGQRKSILGGAKFVASPAPTPAIPSSSAAARQASLQDQALKMLGLPDASLDKASQSALEANDKAYHSAFEQVMQVCSKM
jgi:hypothetical protein